MGSLWDLLGEWKDEKRAFLLRLAVCVPVEDGKAGKESCRSGERAGKAGWTVLHEWQVCPFTVAGVSLPCRHSTGGCGEVPVSAEGRRGHSRDVPCAERCPPARRGLSSPSPGGEPASGCWAPFPRLFLSEGWGRDRLEQVKCLEAGKRHPGPSGWRWPGRDLPSPGAVPAGQGTGYFSPLGKERWLCRQ